MNLLEILGICYFWCNNKSMERIDKCQLPNYILTNSNRARVWDLLESIAGRLACEGVTYPEYSTDKALNALAPCVAGRMLQENLLAYEHEVIGLLK